MRRALGVDIGGSSIKVALLEGDDVSEIAREPHEARGLDAVVAAVSRALERSRDDAPLGVCVAGLVAGGIVQRSGNLSLIDAPLRSSLERALARPIDAFLSDASALGRAALEEHAPERARIVLGLGTGVGGAVLLEGQVVRDRGLGHDIALDEIAPAPCALGHASCLEAFVGARALAREGREAGLATADARSLDALAREGSAPARAILERAGERLARAISRILLETLPRERALVVLAGGVARSELLRKSAGRVLLDRARVVVSRYSDLAAAAGAALAASSSG